MRKDTMDLRGVTPLIIRKLSLVEFDRPVKKLTVQSVEKKSDMLL